MIPIPKPVTIPAKSYDANLITELSITADSPSAGRMAMRLLPYNVASGETAPKEFEQRFVCNDLFRAIAEVPELAAAYAAVLAAVPPTLTWSAEQAAAAADANAVDVDS